MRRWLKNTVLGAMHQWYQWTKYKKEKETNEQEKKATNEKRKKHLKILVGRTLAFRNTSISTACFQWWTTWTVLHKKQWQHIQRIHRRRFIRVMSATFQCWRKESDNTKHVKKIMQRWIRKAQHQQFASSFYKWRDTTRKDAQRKNNEMEAQQATAKATAIVAATVATKVAATLKQHVEDERKKQLFHKIIKNFFRQTTAKAFRSWSDTFKESKRRSEIGKKFVNRMLRRWQYKSFQAWRVFADDMLNAKCVLHRLIFRISSNQYLFFITKGWYKWRELIMYNNNESQAAFKRREKVLMTRVARSFMNQSLRSAFQGWSNNTAQLRRHRNIVKRALIHIGRRTVVTAFDGWCSSTIKRIRAKRLVVRVAARVASKGLFRGMRKWCVWLSLARLEEEREHILLHRVRSVMTKRYIYKSFRGW